MDNGFLRAVVLAVLCLVGSFWVVGGSGWRSSLRRVQEPRARNPRRAWRRPFPRLARRTSDEASVRLLITQVTSLLRAGAPPGAAWRRAAGVPVDEFGVPSLAALRDQIGDRNAVAVVGATRLALTVGAPLASALTSVGDALVAQAESDAEREAALAGPRTTARVLLWLPAVGVVLGIVLGANPIRTATDGGLGTAAVLLGAGAMALGRVWINHLVAVARRAGIEP